MSWSWAIPALQIVTPLGAAWWARWGVKNTIKQKEDSERRSEWWRRATWALERTSDPDDSVAEMAWGLLGGLGSAQVLVDGVLATVKDGCHAEGVF